MSCSTRLLAGLFAFSVTLIFAPLAFAQSPSETITVTGTREASIGVAQTVTAGDAAIRVNAVNSEDLLRYAPDILVRKRHIGDTQDPIATRTSGIGQSARSLIYADGILLSSPIGNNNSAASPHWGLVSPQDISAVEILYGPFAARYAGGSMGAVVSITTRMPDAFETSGKAVAAWQGFSQYATQGDYGSYQLQSEIGDRTGPWAWRLSLNHLDSNSQPLALVTLNRPATASAAGTVVSGGIADVSRTNAPIAVIGAAGFEHQIQDTPTLKTTYDFGAAQLAYIASLFHQNDTASAQSYLKDASGNAVWSGNVNIGGYNYAIPANAFSNNVYRWNQSILAQGLSLTSTDDGDWQWQLAASRTDYLTDNQRVPGVALPTANTGGAGTINRMTGTNWTTLDGSARWNNSAHSISFGAHDDVTALNQNKYNTADWIGGAPTSLASSAKGRTATAALWAEDAYAFAPDWKATLGLRLENWRAYDGVNFSTTPALNVTQPKQSGTYASPKAALRWQADDAISLTASYGTAYRMPTVTELYQAVTTGPTLTSPNPNLRPEHADSYDLSGVYAVDGTRLRVSLFAEDVSDALIAQTAPLGASSTLVSFVQNIDQVRSRGAEAVLSQTLGDVDLQGSVTYLDSIIARDSAFAAAVGKATPNLPRWRVTAGATWHATRALDLSVTGRYQSRLYATIDNSDSVTHTWQGFDSFLVADVRARYALDGHWAAAIGIDNINNDKYFLFHPFPQRSVTLELSYNP